jgi:hypothetical protein
MKKALLILSIVFLVACGSATTQASNAGLPAKSKAVQTAEFVKLASNASCANLRNRLFLIDQKFVLWDKKGVCSDASYSITLFGNTPNTILCTKADSIAGPQTKCEQAQHDDMFDTIINSLDQSDLGLGSKYQVQNIDFNSNTTLKLGIHFDTINSAYYRGTAPQHIVIKNSSAWKKFIADGKIDLASKGVQEPNFATQMVLGTFFPTPIDCSKTQILKLTRDDQSLYAYYSEDKITSIMRCDNSTTLASTPMNLIVTMRDNLPVKFIDVSKQRLSFNQIDMNSQSGVKQKKTIVVKDQNAWKTLWKEHATQGEDLPQIDFTKNMVVGVFLGEKPSACYSIRDVQIWKVGTQINVTHTNILPGSLVKCAFSIVTPAILIEVPLSEDYVEFNDIDAYI